MTVLLTYSMYLATNNANESLIGVYLTPKSIELLQNYLKKNGYDKHSTIPNGFIGNNYIALLLLT